MGAGASAGASSSCGIDGSFQEPSDEFAAVASVAVPAGQRAQRAVLGGRWQGWGNQKGRIRLVHLRGGEELASSVVGGLAPHEVCTLREVSQPSD